MALVVKTPPASEEDVKRCGLDPWVEKIPWRRKWYSAPVFMPGKSHGQRSLVSYGPWGHKESDTTERPSTYCVPGVVPDVGLV